MKYCKVHHFADDTNLLNFNNYIKKINNQVGHDLKYPKHLPRFRFCFVDNSHFRD